MPFAAGAGFWLWSVNRAVSFRRSSLSLSSLRRRSSRSLFTCSSSPLNPSSCACKTAVRPFPSGVANRSISGLLLLLAGNTRYSSAAAIWYSPLSRLMQLKRPDLIALDRVLLLLLTALAASPRVNVACSLIGLPIVRFQRFTNRITQPPAGEIPVLRSFHSFSATESRVRSAPDNPAGRLSGFKTGRAGQGDFKKSQHAPRLLKDRRTQDIDSSGQ